MVNTLIIATTSYAGMGPYVASIVNAFRKDDPMYFIFHDHEDDFYRKNVKAELHDKSLFLKRADSHWNKLLDLLHTKPSQKQLDSLLNYCKKNDIAIVHWINSPGNRFENQYLEEHGIKVLGTVHDLHPHEAKCAPHRMLRFHILNKRNKEAIVRARYLVTNSRTQYKEMQSLFPDKRLFFHDFPSLVTPIVAQGGVVPKELQSQRRPYILFFGRIEEYKGIALLYRAFTESPEISDKYDLVIAGSGQIPFERKSNEQHVTFINRYILDEEVLYLYEHAACVVYPYISATQSGVLSIAYYFGTPVLASDVNFFRSIIAPSGAGRLFKKSNVEDLREQLKYILSHDNSEIISKEKDYYKQYYDTVAIRKELLNIYENINKASK